MSMCERITVSFFIFFFIGASMSAGAQDLEWPRDLYIESGVLTMYQPQVDGLKDDILSFRAAVAYKKDDGSEPVFGAGWFKSRLAKERW
jgi:hypothetical protein